MSYKLRLATGFTLVEVMIVVVIVSILLAVALPAYQEQVRKTKRGLAKGELLGLLTRQEQYFVNNKGYSDTLVNFGYAVAGYSINSDGERDVINAGDGIYNITMTGASSSGFTLNATPLGGQAKDVRCKTLTITSAGKKDIVGGTATADECW
jgi:type IV pilus assembly protein PilE